MDSTSSVGSAQQTPSDRGAPLLQSDSVDVQYYFVSCRLFEFAEKSRDLLERLTSNTISCEDVLLSTKPVLCLYSSSRINRKKFIKTNSSCFHSLCDTQNLFTHPKVQSSCFSHFSHDTALLQKEKGKHCSEMNI